MRETLLALYKLQQIDLRALELERAAEQIPKKVAEYDSELDVYRAELGTLHSEADGLRGEQREAEGQIRDDSAKAQKWKRRLNDIRTPREYQALSREVEQTERHVRELEEKVIALMEELEARDKIIVDKETELKGREAEVAEVVRDLRTKQAKLKGEAHEISQGRNAIVKGLPEKTMKVYERVRGRRQGMAVAVTSGTCSGCNVEIRPQHMVEIRRLNSIEQCSGCLRILVLESLVTGAEG